MSGPEQAIAELRCAPGEISFEARLAGGARRISFRADLESVPGADVALAACLLPAMRAGGVLEVPEPVSPRLLRTLREYRAIQRAWSRDWDLGEEPLREVEVRAPLREPPAAGEPAPSGRVGAFFSGGVDSWATVLENPDLTDLIFVRGLDLLPGNPDHLALGDEIEARLREAAAALALPLHVVTTDVRQLSDPLIRWEAFNPSAMAAAALLFEGTLDRVLIAGDTGYSTEVPLGASMLVDQLWSTERLQVADGGGRLDRVGRLRRLVAEPAACRSLRVCWQNPAGAYNCGRCHRCLMTMIALESIGARERVETFPRELDLGLLPGCEISQPIQLVLWEELVLVAAAEGRRDLARAVEPVVERGRRALGLPGDFSARPDRGAGGYLGALRAAEARSAGAEAAEREARALLDAARGSHSWRATRPLRRLGDELRRRRAQ
jgi:hypothetical protein